MKSVSQKDNIGHFAEEVPLGADFDNVTTVIGSGTNASLLSLRQFYDNYADFLANGVFVRVNRYKDASQADPANVTSMDGMKARGVPFVLVNVEED